METVVWICQCLLGTLFFSAGFTKWRKPTRFSRTGSNPPIASLRIIGTSEMLGAVGIILPWALGILPLLTPISAVGFAIIMFFALIIHLKKKEHLKVMFTTLVLFVSLFVAVYRFRAI